MNIYIFYRTGHPYHEYFLPRSERNIHISGDGQLCISSMWHKATLAKVPNKSFNKVCLSFWVYGTRPASPRSLIKVSFFTKFFGTTTISILKLNWIVVIKNFSFLFWRFLYFKHFHSLNITEAVTKWQSFLKLTDTWSCFSTKYILLLLKLHL